MRSVQFAFFSAGLLLAMPGCAPKATVAEERAPALNQQEAMKAGDGEVPWQLGPPPVRSIAYQTSLRKIYEDFAMHTGIVTQARILSELGQPDLFVEVDDGSLLVYRPGHAAVALFHLDARGEVARCGMNSLAAFEDQLRGSIRNGTARVAEFDAALSIRAAEKPEVAEQTRPSTRPAETPEQAPDYYTDHVLPSTVPAGKFEEWQERADPPGNLTTTTYTRLEYDGCAFWVAVWGMDGGALGQQMMAVYAPAEDGSFERRLLAETHRMAVEISLDIETGLLEVRGASNDDLKGQVVLSCNLSVIPYARAPGDAVD